jgi:hypothetical protein
MKTKYNDWLVFLDAPVVILEGALGIHLECHQFHRPFSVSVIVLKLHGLISSGGSLSTASNWVWTSVPTCGSWLSLHKSCGVNCFSKQSAFVLAFSNGRNFSPKGQWMVNKPLFHPVHEGLRNVSYCWDVISMLAIFVSQRWSALLRVLCLIVFECQLNSFYILDPSFLATVFSPLLVF